MTATLAEAMSGFAPGLPLAVAFSGGADSTALLLACTHKWPGQVHAVHIHHGVQAAADDFERHCQEFCARLSVPLTVRRVDGRHAGGQSPEDAARQARYTALESVASQEYAALGVRDIALAQHADDQVETLLLALSRGAGLPGLSAMPATWTRGGVTYHRPFLRARAADIRAWLAEQGVSYIEDPSNAQMQYTRNRIRAHLLPALEASFEQFHDTFARSAAHAAQAQAVLLEVATLDLALMGSPPDIAQLQRLSRPRQANALRHWLRQTIAATPSAAQLNELLDQIAACRTRAHQIHIKVGAGFVERRGAVLHWYNAPVLS